MTITAKTLLDLLLAKHAKDVCVPECKTGGTWYRDYQAMDLWTMAKSWAKPKIIVYEIKISRNDFLKDDKWRGYLQYGNELYFVAPPGIITKEELSPEAGLIVTSKNGTRLYTKKKAPFRNVQVPDSVFRYILMWRVKLIAEQGPESKQEYWKRFLLGGEYSRELGYKVSRKLRGMIGEEIEKVRAQNDYLKRENEGLANVRDFLVNNGISERMIQSGDVMRYDRHKLQRIIQESGTGVPEGLPGAVGNAIRCLETLNGMIGNAA